MNHLELGSTKRGCGLYRDVGRSSGFTCLHLLETAWTLLHVSLLGIQQTQPADSIHTVDHNQTFIRTLARTAYEIGRDAHIITARIELGHHVLSHEVIAQLALSARCELARWIRTAQDAMTSE